MAITYHAGRRIQGLEYTASNLTTSGFAQTWGKDPSNSQFEVSGGKINFLDNTSSTGDRTWLDLESIIGSAVSTTQWVLRFKFNFSTLTSGTYYYEFDAGLSDTTVNNITAQNFIGVRVLPSNFNNLWRPRTCDGSTNPRSGATASIAQSFSTGTDYYCEIKRTSSSNWSISLSTTDAYDGDIQDNSYTDAGSSTGLRYFKFGDAVTNTGSGFTMQGVCDVLEFYNDTTTIVVASGDEKPTNVQAGSRFEETDTRKMYHKADEYKVHSFTSSGTFTVTGSGDVEYLVVAGGGGAGVGHGGGGGAGGYRTNVVGATSGGGSSAEASYPVTVQDYTVTVGAAGNGAVGGGGKTGGSGGTSSIVPVTSGTTITTTGGGGGYGQGTGNGAAGGSGGGSRAGTGGAGTTDEGYAGGDGGSGGTAPSGGGGGAGAVGVDGASGDGGAGQTNSITGSAVTRAGGGGAWDDSGTGTGGTGGGGDGNAATGSSDGTANTGSGGGSSGTPAGNGGSGIVIIRYKTSSSITATGGTITTIGGWSEEGT